MNGKEGSDKEGESWKHDFFPKGTELQFRDNREKLDAPFMGKGHRHPQNRRVKNHVGIRCQNPFAGGGARRQMQGMHFAVPLGRQCFVVKNLEPTTSSRLRCPLVRYGSRVVLRVIIHKNNFKIGIVKRQEGFERGGKRLFLVARGHNDGYSRKGLEGG